MRYIAIGKIHPERADIEFSRVEMTVGTGHVAIQCESSQLAVSINVPELNDVTSAFIHAEELASLVTHALGFSLGCGYSVEVIQVIDEGGIPYVFGVKPANSLGFEDHIPRFNQALNLAAHDIFFRSAMTDFVRALTEVMDCSMYCYRALESIKGGVGFRTNDNSWQSMHRTLGTDREIIESTVKIFADPIRHGNWIGVKPTSEGDRYAMLKLTQMVLTKYLDYAPLPTTNPDN